MNIIPSGIKSEKSNNSSLDIYVDIKNRVVKTVIPPVLSPVYREQNGN